jgi:hypothetical protein
LSWATAGTWTAEQFDLLIATNKRDFDTRLAKARVLLVSGDWTAAMDELLEIIMRDKAWNDALPRKTYVAILELLTPPKPKVDPLATGKTCGWHRDCRQGRRRAGPASPDGRQLPAQAQHGAELKTAQPRPP